MLGAINQPATRESTCNKQGMTPDANTKALVVAAMVVTLLCIAAVATLVLLPGGAQAPPVLHALQQNQLNQLNRRPRDPGSTVVVGTGLTASAALWRMRTLGALPPRLQVVEASHRAGGRALSTVGPVTPVSTATACQEFGAWVYDPVAEPHLVDFLTRLGVPGVPVTLTTEGTFIYDGTSNIRLPYGELPPCGGPGVPYHACTPQETDVLLWRAHIGVDSTDAPDAEVDLVRVMDFGFPEGAVQATPSGFGWQGVVLRALGDVPVTYGQRLVAVATQPRLALTFATVTPGSDGQPAPDAVLTTRDDVDAAVLTLTHNDMLRIAGLPPAIADVISASFTTVPVGTLYLAWPSMDVWWPGAGFVTGSVATNLPIGRIFAVGPNLLRCSVFGADNVAFWSAAVTAAVDGEEAVATGKQAATAAAQQLSRVFNVPVSPPASVNFMGWKDGVVLWRAGVDRAAVSAQLSRPWGPDVPVWWASADLSTSPGKAAGAVAAGCAVADTLLFGSPIRQ